MAASVADLAPRLDVDEAEITPVSATSVMWPNGGLGCPEPGMQYAQVLVDGSLVELEHGGQVYRYHVGGSGDAPFLCDPARAVPPVGGGNAGAGRADPLLSSGPGPQTGGSSGSRRPLTKRRSVPSTGSVNASSLASSCSGRVKSSIEVSRTTG